jgi:hypothetical protein
MRAEMDNLSRLAAGGGKRGAFNNVGIVGSGISFENLTEQLQPQRYQH